MGDGGARDRPPTHIPGECCTRSPSNAQETRKPSGPPRPPPKPFAPAPRRPGVGAPEKGTPARGHKHPAQPRDGVGPGPRRARGGRGARKQGKLPLSPVVPARRLQPRPKTHRIQTAEGGGPVHHAFVSPGLASIRERQAQRGVRWGRPQVSPGALEVGGQDF